MFIYFYYLLIIYYLLCRDNDIDDLEMGLYFTIDYKVFGELKTHELIPNGSSVEVTDENKHLYAEYILC
jgi:hypothetical protein